MKRTVRLFLPLLAASSLTLACAGADTDAPAPEGPAGYLELPLETQAEDGTPVRLVSAALHIETDADSLPVIAPAEEAIFVHALPVSLRRVVLTGPWHLEAMEAGVWHPLAGRLAGSPVWEAPTLIDGEVTEIGFRFDTALGPVALGAPR